jgi:lysophospholipase L1-like esterase
MLLPVQAYQAGTLWAPLANAQNIILDQTQRNSGMILKRALPFQVAMASLVVIGTTVHAQSTQLWTGTWSVAPQQTTIGSSFNNLSQQTLRQILHTSIGGSAVRVQISNAFGQQPLVVSDVHVAKAVVNSDGSPTSSTFSGTDHAVTFSGATTVNIPAGQIVSSDGVTFSLPIETDVMVSMYFPQGVDSANSTFHQEGGQNGMFLSNGDVSASTTFSPYSTFSSYFYLTNLDVQNANATGALVALGASITDRVNSSFNMNRRWTNFLATRLNQAGLTVGVLNKGISGNDLLRDGAGQSAENRFARDVLAQPNVKWVIFSDDPINDLSGSGTPPSYDSLVAGIKQIMGQAHAQGIKFYCSTLTPNGGRPANQWTSAAETIREQLNAFYLAADSGCDGIVDQDTATHDPGNPTQYLPAFNTQNPDGTPGPGTGDFLHPNDAGMQAIANSVNTGLLAVSGVTSFKAPSNSCSLLLSGEGVIADHPIYSCDRRFELYLQDGGNLILYEGKTILWTARSEGHTPSVATLLADGNFVVEDQTGKIFWQTRTSGLSGTAGLSGQALVVQNDGNLVLYNSASGPAAAVWASNTCCH